MKPSHLISLVFVIGLLLFVGCEEQVQVAAPAAELKVKSMTPQLETAKPEPVVRSELQPAPAPKSVTAVQTQSPQKPQSPETAAPKPAANEPTGKIKFAKTVHDFGPVSPSSRNSCNFTFTNVGEGVLKIGKIKSTCGCTVPDLKKKNYAPGESGTVKVTYRTSSKAGPSSKLLYVPSNDKTRPRVTLTVKAKIELKVEFKPKRLSLSIKKENAGCPDITIKSLDGKEFAISKFKVTGDAISFDYDPLVKSTQFVLKPKVNIEKIKSGFKGHIEITLTHPDSKKIVILFDALAEFQVKPGSINVLKAEPNKAVKRDVWILNNYNDDFEIESVTSRKGIAKALKTEKIKGRYKLTIEITPPEVENKSKMVSDVISVNIKGKKKVEIACRVFYAIKKANKPSGRPKRTTIPSTLNNQSAESVESTK